MDEILAAISSVGFPIVACYMMYRSNQEELKSLRQSVEKNTEATVELSTTVKVLHNNTNG